MPGLQIIAASSKLAFAPWCSELDKAAGIRLSGMQRDPSTSDGVGRVMLDRERRCCRSLGSSSVRRT
jgi:hypothetical protein